MGLATIETFVDARKIPRRSRGMDEVVFVASVHGFSSGQC